MLNVINGRASSPSEFPSFVSLLFGGSPLCGGVVVGDTTVLTAAHCLDGVEARNVVVVLSDGRRVMPSSGTKHPSYDREGFVYDAAVLRFAGPLGVPASPVGAAGVGDRLTIVGKGDTSVSPVSATGASATGFFDWVGETVGGAVDLVGDTVSDWVSTPSTPSATPSTPSTPSATPSATPTPSTPSPSIVYSPDFVYGGDGGAPTPPPPPPPPPPDFIDAVGDAVGGAVDLVGDTVSDWVTSPSTTPSPSTPTTQPAPPTTPPPDFFDTALDTLGEVFYDVGEVVYGVVNGTVDAVGSVFDSFGNVVGDVFEGFDDGYDPIDEYVYEPDVTPGSAPSSIPLVAEMTVVEGWSCTIDRRNPSKICAVSQRQGICGGDSGGPAFKDDRVVGLVSTTVTGCGKAVTGRFEATFTDLSEPSVRALWESASAGAQPSSVPMSPGGTTGDPATSVPFSSAHARVPTFVFLVFLFLL